MDAQWRSEAGADCNNVQIFDPDGNAVQGDSDAAIWLRVSRIAEADLVIAEYSYDGESWIVGDMRNMAFPESIAWGVAITNHADNEGLAVAWVEGVRFEKPRFVIGERKIEGPQYFDADSFYKAGDSFRITLQLTNTGDESQDVDIVETVPSGWLIEGISDGGTADDGVVRWSNLSVNTGTKTIEYTVVAPDDPEIKVTFTGTIGAMEIGGANSMSLLSDGIGIFDAHADVGDVESAGGAFYDDGRDEIAIDGGGEDIWGAQDEFHFMFKEISGPFAFRGHVELDSFESSSEWIKAGLMVRDGLADDSVNGFIFIRTDYQMDAQWRSVNGGATADLGVNPDNYGDFELVRIGDKVWLNYVSAETGEMTESVELDLPLSDPVYVGLAVTSHEDGSLATGFFSDIELENYDGFVERDLSSQAFSIDGDTIEGNRVIVRISDGITANHVLQEELPSGFQAENVRVTNGEASVSDGVIAWTLDGLSGVAEMTYDSIVPSAYAWDIATFSGDYSNLPVIGDRYMYPVAFQIPYINRKTSLDGEISSDEYRDAYSETFDHEDSAPPGVHWDPAGGYVDRAMENATFYVFQNDECIFVAVDVVDRNVLDFDSGAEVWSNDSVELYLDGNFSRLAEKENGPLGFQATVLGNGLNADGNDAPIMSLVDGGGVSTDGAYWNAAAKAKETMDGYVVEYVLQKDKVMDRLDRSLIGFDILINGGDGSGVRSSKWGYWNTSLGLLETDKEYWNDERGWAIVELIAGEPTRALNWTLY